MSRFWPPAVAAAAFALAVGLPASDPDMYWHLASGRWMVENRAILREDIFSSTIAGREYSVGQWLGEIVLYAAYASGGWSGIAVLRAVLVATMAFFATRVALRERPPLAATVLLVFVAIVFTKITWTDRPQLFTLALLPLMLDLLLGARAGGTRRLLFVPPLVFVWTALHGGYALGLALVAIFAADALIARRPAVPFLAAGVAAFALSLLDPGNFGAPAAAAHVAAPPRFLVEASPPDVLTPAGMLFALFVLASLAAAFRGAGTVLDALLLVPLLALALSAQRYMPYYVIASLPLIARAIAPFAPRPRRIPRRVMPAMLGAALVVALWAGAIASSLGAPSAPDESAYPVAAVAQLVRGDGVLLNEYDWGGFLIWRVPERPVFIDGRFVPYLPDVLGDYRQATELRQGWRDVLAQRDVTQVLVRPRRPFAVALREEGWRVVHEDERSVLLERPR